MNFKSIASVVLVPFFCAGFSFAAPLKAGPPLKIGVVGETPFLTFSGDRPDGFVVALWTALADNLKLNYELVPLGYNTDDSLVKLRNGEIDALIGQVAVTTDRLREFTFSRPFFLNTLVAVGHARNESFWSVINHIIQPFMQIGMFVFVGAILIFAFMFWYGEHRASKGAFRLGDLSNAVYGTWLGLFSQGYPDYPGSWLARFSVGLTIILSLVFSTLFSAAVTTAFTISSSNIQLAVDSYDTLERYHTVAVRSGGYEEHLLKNHHVKYSLVGDFEEGLALLDQGKVDFVIESNVVVKAKWSPNYDSRYSYFNMDIGASEMAFAFPHRSELVKPVDIGLTHLQESSRAYRICLEFLDAENVKYCII